MPADRFAAVVTLPEGSRAFRSDLAAVLFMIARLPSNERGIVRNRLMHPSFVRDCDPDHQPAPLPGKDQLSTTGVGRWREHRSSGS